MPPSSESPPDELILQHLGASTMLCWNRLPVTARELILMQADDVIGLPPVRESRREIVKLLLRNTKAQWQSSLLMLRQR